MCGVTGFLGGEKSYNLNDSSPIINSMLNKIHHRGPDDHGYWSDSNKGVNLGHKRLSIVDLSQTGHQPMHSISKRYVVVFNGEIYNHMKLRQNLVKENKSSNWVGTSDTETLLAGFDAWGIEKTITNCIGMFSLAIWDKANKTLNLIVDRIGEKPMYYGWQGVGKTKTFLFGSELKALKEHPAFEKNINRDSLSLLMRHSYISHPNSIWKGIHKLEPGTILTISLNSSEPKLTKYWSAEQTIKNGRLTNNHLSKEEAISQLDILLKDIISKQMLADVPVGAFLSGGVDSSTIAAHMQAQSTSKIKTFTIGFNEDKQNEAEYAKKIAAHLGTEHTELILSSTDAKNIIPMIPTIYDEPFADSSQIPTYLVSKLARNEVKVALTGDGADEMLCGYNRYQVSNRLWSKFSGIPHNLRKIGSKTISSIPSGVLNSLHRVFPMVNKSNNFSDRVYKGARLLQSKNFDQFYLDFISYWDNPESLIINSKEPKTSLNRNLESIENMTDIDRMMYLDLLSYLPGDILTKVDRASMAVSLETRLPFLDHRLIEFAWSLPNEYKYNNGQTKWILKEVLNKYIPKNLYDRPKQGFGIPINEWLKGSLKEWGEDLLSEEKLENQGFFDAKKVRKKWIEHQSGKSNWQHQLWNVLMFQSWLEENN
jgi:asparagine synthase (glutamine-hydrolysing)